MNSILEQRVTELQEICRRRTVQRLSVFGSAAAGGFDPARSDLDFVVLFPALSPSQHADCYFGLQEDLEKLFGCSIDLIELAPLRNPYFRRAVEQTQELIYAAS